MGCSVASAAMKGLLPSLFRSSSVPLSCFANSWGTSACGLGKSMNPHSAIFSRTSVKSHFTKALYQQFALEFILLKWHGEIFHEPQHGVLALGEPSQQIAGYTLIASSPLGQMTLQLLDLCAQVFDLRFQLQQFREQSANPGIFSPKAGVCFSKHLDFVLHHVFTVLFWGRFGKGSR